MISKETRKAGKGSGWPTWLALVVLAGTWGCENAGRAVNSPCETNTDCASQICHNGICASKDPKDNGSTCKGDGECKSFRCVNDVCLKGDRDNGRPCKDNAECASNNCKEKKCAPAVTPDGGADATVPDQALPDLLPVPDNSVPDQTLSPCADKKKNNDETDVDCGGMTCPKCKDTMNCKKVMDCLSGICTGGKCIKGCVHQPVAMDCFQDKEGIKWCKIPAGCFMMGSPGGEPCRVSSFEVRHQVTLTHGIAVQRKEVTQGQFKALMGYNPAAHGPDGIGSYKGKCTASDCPVEYVNWHEAAAFCNALSKLNGLPNCYINKGSGKACTADNECGKDEVCQNATKCIQYEPAAKFTGKAIYTCKGFRMPTEAEWEYAYRAGTTAAYYSGKNDGSLCSKCTPKDPNADIIGWYCYNSNKQTQPVGKKPANDWGLHDMAGNVWEWCHDDYAGNIGSSPVTDPVGSISSSARVFRGGASNAFPADMRAAKVSGFSLTKRMEYTGFRCLRTK